MNKKRIELIAVGAVGIVIIVLIFVLISLVGRKEDSTVRVGFVMSGSTEETGWNGMHYNSVLTSCEKLGVELMVKEEVREFTGACNEAIRELVEEGADMLILSSYGYSEEAKELVKEYPQVAFYVNSSEHHDVNMTSYFARIYQARYLAGIVAGMKTNSNEIGYVAAMENNEVNRGINAFARGVRRVNPEAEVVVIWTGDWDSADREKECAGLLIEKEGVDVLTYHQNQPNVIYAAEEKGVYSIGYHEPVEGCSDKYLTSVVCRWELIYEQLIREFLIGESNENANYWIGLEADAVDLSRFSPEVTSEIVEELELAKQEILSGKDVFSGEIYDNQGTLRCFDAENISDNVLLEQMDWFVEGVRFYEE